MSNGYDKFWETVERSGEGKRPESQKQDKKIPGSDIFWKTVGLDSPSTQAYPQQSGIEYIDSKLKQYGLYDKTSRPGYAMDHDVAMEQYGYAPGITAKDVGYSPSMKASYDSFLSGREKSNPMPEAVKSQIDDLQNQIDTLTGKISFAEENYDTVGAKSLLEQQRQLQTELYQLQADNAESEYDRYMAQYKLHNQSFLKLLDGDGSDASAEDYRNFLKNDKTAVAAKDNAEMIDYIAKYAGKDRKDNFGGQFAANYDIGKINEDSAAAWDEYLSDPTEENRRKAEALSVAAQEYQAKNAAALDDENAVLPWITKSLASYLPQFVNQQAMQIPLGIITAVATLNPANYKYGATVGSGVYSYRTMRGTAFRSLVEAGVPEEKARAAANDEAVISSMIEMGETFLSLSAFGMNKLSGGAVGNAGAKIAGALESNMPSSAARALLKVGKALAAYGINIFSESQEERSQEAVSIANENRDYTKDTGIGDLAYAALKKYIGGFTGSGATEEEIERMKESEAEGAKLAAMLGGVETAQAAILNGKLNSSAKRYTSDVNSMIEEGMESPEGTKARKYAEEARKKVDSGKTLSGYQIRELAEANAESILSQDVGKITKAVEKQLTDRGYEGGNTKELAAAVAKTVAGQETTRAERKAIRNSEQAKQILQEIAGASDVVQKYAESGASYQAAEQNAELAGEQLEQAQNDVSMDADFQAAAENFRAADEKRTAAKEAFDAAQNEYENGSTAWARSIGARVVGDGVLSENSVEGYAHLFGKHAKLFTEAYEDGQDARQYTIEFAKAYNEGTKGGDLQSLIDSGSIPNLSTVQINAAYQAGLDARNSLNTRRDTDGLHLRQSSIWENGANSTADVQEVEANAEQNQKRNADSGRQTAAEKAAGFTAEKAYRRVTTLEELGVKDAKAGIKVTQVSSDYSDETAKAYEMCVQNGVQCVFFTGGYLQTKDGIIARGANKGGVVYIRADDPNFTANEIAGHEIGHELVRRGSLDMDAVISEVRKEYTKEELSKIVDDYGLDFLADGMNEDELTDITLEEITCDALGGMNAFASNREGNAEFIQKLQGLAEKHYTGKTGEGTDTQKRSTNAATDSSQKLSTVTEAQDSEYMELAKDPEKNREKLESMVWDAAEKAGYKGMYYHGSKKGGGFTKFRDWQYFTQNRDYAKRYSERGNDASLYSVFVKMDNLFDTRNAEERAKFADARLEYGLGELQENGLPDWTDGYDLVDYIEENGLPYDSIVLDEGGDLVNGKPVSRGLSYVVRKSSQIKSAEPVTYDNNGDVIPLSRRFDQLDEDIRFSYVSMVEETDNEKSNRIKNAFMPITIARNNGSISYESTGMIHMKKQEATPIISAIANKFNDLSALYNRELDVEFSLSNRGISRSASHQIEMTGMDYAPLAYVAENLTELCRNAYPVEAHTDYKPKTVSNLESAVTLFSALQKGNDAILVKMTLKVPKSSIARLHMVISTEIKKGTNLANITTLENHVVGKNDSLYITLPHFIELVKDNHEFLKRIPVEDILTKNQQSFSTVNSTQLVLENPDVYEEIQVTFDEILQKTKGKDLEAALLEEAQKHQEDRQLWEHEAAVLTKLWKQNDRDYQKVRKALDRKRKRLKAEIDSMNSNPGMYTDIRILEQIAEETIEANLSAAEIGSLSNFKRYLKDAKKFQKIIDDINENGGANTIQDMNRVKLAQQKIDEITPKLWTIANNRRLQDLIGRTREALIQKYGTIPEGENASRESNIPMQTSETTKVSRTARTAVEASGTTDEMAEKITEKVVEGGFSYVPISDDGAKRLAEETIKRNGFNDAALDWFKTMGKTDNPGKNEIAMGWTLYNNAVNAGDTKTAMKILTEITTTVRNAAQTVQANRILKQLSPENRLYAIRKQLDALQQDLDSRYGDKAPQIDMNSTLVLNYLSARGDKDIRSAEKALYQNIASQLPNTFLDKWNSWRYLSMLGNMRTHIRNIAGNAGFLPVRATKDAIAAIIESGVNSISKDGIERTKGILIGAKDRKLYNAGVDDFKTVSDLMENATTKSSDTLSQIERMKPAFGGNSAVWRVLSKAAEANSWALGAEDMVFKKITYAAAFGGYLKAHDVTESMYRNGELSDNFLDQARAYAMEEALKATYNDCNAFSDFVARVGKLRYSNNITEKIAGHIVEGILPFKRTPANILVRSVEYSPIGLMNGIKKCIFDVRNGKSTASEAIDALASGLTGTLLLGLGYFLANLGLIKGGEDDDKKQSKFDKLRGDQSYSLVIGDKNYTIDWLAPEVIPMFVGAEIQRFNNDGSIGIGTVLDALSRVTEPLLEMSMLSGLNDMLDNISYSDKKLYSIISTAAASYVMQGLPTIMGQLERTGETVRETTYVDKESDIPKDMQYTIAKAANKIPGIEYNQIPYIDAYGRQQKTGNVATRAFSNFLSPGYIGSDRSAPWDDELQKLYDAGQTNVFPVIPDDTDIKGYVMDGDELVKFRTAAGEKKYELLEALFDSVWFNQLPDEDKADCISKVYSYANAYGKKQIVKTFESSKTNEAIHKYLINGGSIVSYFKNKMDKK